MTGPEEAVVIADEAASPATPLPWPETQDRLAAAQTYWLATTTRRGRPHVRPVLGVWVDGSLYASSGPAAAKAQNLVADDRCSLSVSLDATDVVVEGTATRITDGGHLQRVADAYHAKYGWPATVVGDAFDAPYGAPTAGPPPYHVYEITPTVVYAFGTDDEHAPRSTRWRF